MNMFSLNIYFFFKHREKKLGKNCFKTVIRYILVYINVSTNEIRKLDESMS